MESSLKVCLFKILRGSIFVRYRSQYGMEGDFLGARPSLEEADLSKFFSDLPNFLLAPAAKFVFDVFEIVLDSPMR